MLIPKEQVIHFAKYTQRELTVWIFINTIVMDWNAIGFVYP